MKKKKTCKEKNKNEKQRTLLQAEIDVVGKKICDVQKNCDVFDLEFVSSMMEADKIKRSSLCPQGNAWKRKNNEMKRDMKVNEEILFILQKKQK